MLGRTIRRYKYTDAHYAGNITLPPVSEGQIMPPEWFEETISVPFEWFEINVPSQYDNYLKGVYGDYHKIVVGGSVHGEIFFNVEKPYTDFIFAIIVEECGLVWGVGIILAYLLLLIRY